MKIVYVEVKNKTLHKDENVEGWGVVLNGNLIATDSYDEFITCGEIAENIAYVLSVPLEETTVEVSGEWDWVSDVLPKIGVSQKQPTSERAGEGGLHSRINALRNGDPKTDRFLNTIEEALLRYIFVASYVAANKESADWPELC